MLQNSSSKNFYRFRYWPSWLIVALFWALSKLPYRAQLFLGKHIGLFLYSFNTKHKRVAQANLSLCFPNLNEHERKALLRKNFVSIGIGIFETALAWWGSKNKLRPLAHIHGEDHLKHALKEGKGVMLYGAHFTTLELVGRLFAMQYDFSVIYRKHKIPFINHLISAIYQKNYFGMIERHDVRATLKRLKKGEIVWFTPDVDAGHFHNVFAPFFNIQASSMIASSRLPAITHAKVIPARFYRRENGKGYDIYLSPALDDFPTKDVQQDIARINKITEKAIREKPDQYMWQYMRFKTRPKGEQRFYK